MCACMCESVFLRVIADLFVYVCLCVFLCVVVRVCARVCVPVCVTAVLHFRVSY